LQTGLEPFGTAQTLLHVPQLFGSVLTSTHCPQHGVMLPEHGGVHMPQLQLLPDGHLLPHDPQFEGSVMVSALHPPPPSCGPVDESMVPSMTGGPSLDDASVPGLPPSPAVAQLETLTTRASAAMAMTRVSRAVRELLACMGSGAEDRTVRRESHLDAFADCLHLPGPGARRWSKLARP